MKFSENPPADSTSNIYPFQPNASPHTNHEGRTREGKGTESAGEKPLTSPSTPTDCDDEGVQILTAAHGVRALLAEMEDVGVTVRLDGEDLITKPRPSPEMVTRLKAHKAEIVELLRKENEPPVTDAMANHRPLAIRAVKELQNGRGEPTLGVDHNQAQMRKLTIQSRSLLVPECQWGLSRPAALCCDSSERLRGDAGIGNVALCFPAAKR